MDWAPDAGASVTLALEERQRWEWSKIGLPNAGASVTLAAEERRR